MRHEIRTFEKLLKRESRSIMDDAFIRAYIEDLLKNIRTQVHAPPLMAHARAADHARSDGPCGSQRGTRALLAHALLARCVARTL